MTNGHQLLLLVDTETYVFWKQTLINGLFSVGHYEQTKIYSGAFSLKLLDQNSFCNHNQTFQNQLSSADTNLLSGVLIALKIVDELSFQWCFLC